MWEYVNVGIRECGNRGNVGIEVILIILIVLIELWALCLTWIYLSLYLSPYIYISHLYLSMSVMVIIFPIENWLISSEVSIGEPMLAFFYLVPQCHYLPLTIIKLIYSYY